MELEIGREISQLTLWISIEKKQ